ncbi:hypothetical protein AHF37_03885 [Paragonimus kellicotti]|nr:hypothetical protein AHF37_03885 [Paragonimus kellicotti]
MAAKVRNTLESKDVKSNPPGVADQLNSPSVPNTSQPATNTPLRPSAASNSSTPVVVIRSIATTPGSTAVTGAGIRIASVLPSSFKVTSSNAIIRPVVSIPAVKPIILPSPVVKSSPNPADPLPGVKSESIPTAPSVPNPVPQRNIIREMQVRVPNRRDKRFSVLRFHSADHPDLSSGLELFMQRENNLKQFRSVHNLSDAPERGAGSEFGREAKEEARLRKYGIIRESYRPDDQPWIMTVGKGKTGRRRFKGVREGSVSENVEYFVFCQCKDGNFDAYPVHTCSSSVDGESSSYSSSSSDSDLDPDEKAKKNSKKAILFQKLSETIGTTPGTSGDLGDSVNSVSGLKRRPTETGESLTASPSSAQPAGKKSRLELPVSTTAAVTPTSTSSVPCDTELMSTVRKYLMRKPITVTELLKKIRLRKLVGKNEDAQTALANVLRQLRPIKQIINGQHALSLKH